MILAAGSLVGFIALAGSAIVWTRFSAVEVPPDQVVAVYPRGQLVALASAPLLIFGLVGMLAAGLCYLIDPKGRATIGMTRGLLTLLGVEGLAVIVFIAPHNSAQQWLLGAALFVLALGACFWITFLFEDPKVVDAPNEIERARRVHLEEVRLKKLRSGFEVPLRAGVVVAGIAALVVRFVTGEHGWMLFAASCALLLVPSIVLLLRLNEGGGRLPKGAPGNFQVPFTRRGMVLIGIVLVSGGAATSCVMQSIWVPFSLVAAAALFVGLWRAAVVPKEPKTGSFLWFGLAVFLSVPLFGTLTWMIQNVAEPQVQPMAMIRKGDGAEEYLQGLYVAETSDRVYFATISTKGCTTKFVPGSGRLLSVPKSEVVAIAVGPLQNVKRARRTALEMSYALAPAAASPAVDTASLTVQERRAEANGGARARTRRLESAGEAVAPSFGSGLRLEPESAKPGDVVTLRTSLPGREVGGFGQSPKHRTVRVGGVAAEVVRETSHTPWEAEFATSDGRVVSLDEKVYEKSDGDFNGVEEGEAHSGPLYVRIADSSVVKVEEHWLTSDPAAAYLRLVDPTSRARLAHFKESQRWVKLKDGRWLKLEPKLARQAWHRDHIKFRIPEGARSGPVNVQCSRLSNSPLLRVAQPPEPRITVRFVPGTDRVLFNSSRSRNANGRIVARHWRVQGQDSGGGKRLSEELLPGRHGYLIHLTVVDSDGQAGVTELRIFRLPQKLVTLAAAGNTQEVTWVKGFGENLVASIRKEPPESIELDARPGSNSAISTAAAVTDTRTLTKDLFESKDVTSAAAGPEGFLFRTLAYPASCQSTRGRYDVMVLGKGVQVVSTPECPPLRSETTHQLFVPSVGAEP